MAKERIMDSENVYSAADLGLKSDDCGMGEAVDERE
jgi:hypothetical protein